jgi:hypothetical protein
MSSFGAVFLDGYCTFLVLFWINFELYPISFYRSEKTVDKSGKKDALKCLKNEMKPRKKKDRMKEKSQKWKEKMEKIKKGTRRSKQSFFIDHY